MPVCGTDQLPRRSVGGKLVSPGYHWQRCVTLQRRPMQPQEIARNVPLITVMLMATVPMERARVGQENFSITLSRV